MRGLSVEVGDGAAAEGALAARLDCEVVMAGLPGENCAGVSGRGPAPPEGEETVCPAITGRVGGSGETRRTTVCALLA